MTDNNTNKSMTEKEINSLANKIVAKMMPLKNM